MARFMYLVCPTLNGRDSVLHQPSRWHRRWGRHQERVGNTLLRRSKQRHPIQKNNAHTDTHMHAHTQRCFIMTIRNDTGSPPLHISFSENFNLRKDKTPLSCYTPPLVHPASLQGYTKQTSWIDLDQAPCSSPLQFWKRLCPATKQMHTSEKTKLFNGSRTLPKCLPTGATELIRTPEAAHSIARLFVKLSTAALAAPVWLSGRIH